MINVINKLKQSDLPSLEEGGERLSLLELNALVRRSLEQCLPDEYWIPFIQGRTKKTDICGTQILLIK